VIGGFTFEEGGRTYVCTPEKRTTPPLGTWWWFTVSSDSHRYAPFEASSSDTRQSIRERVVEFYERRLHARAQPAEPQQQFGRSGRPPKAAGQPGQPGQRPSANP